MNDDDLNCFFCTQKRIHAKAMGVLKDKGIPVESIDFLERIDSDKIKIWFTFSWEKAHEKDTLVVPSQMFLQK